MSLFLQNRDVPALRELGKYREAIFASKHREWFSSEVVDGFSLTHVRERDLEWVSRNSHICDQVFPPLISIQRELDEFFVYQGAIFATKHRERFFASEVVFPYSWMVYR